MSESIYECDCGAKVRFPEWDASRSYQCPKCKKGLAITVDSLVLKSVSLNAGQETICPICQSEINANESCVNCPDCDIVYHQECWSEVGGCGTYGCKQASVIDKSESTSSAPLTAWGDTKKCPACGEEIKSISLRCRYCKTDFDSVDPMSAKDLIKQAKVGDEFETLKKWVVTLFVVSLFGFLAPLIAAVSLAYLLPRQAKLNRCGPLFVIMGWTSIGLSILYTVLLLLFFLSQEI